MPAAMQPGEFRGTYVQTYIVYISDAEALSELFPQVPPPSPASHQVACCRCGCIVWCKYLFNYVWAASRITYGLPAAESMLPLRLQRLVPRRAAAAAAPTGGGAGFAAFLCIGSIALSCYVRTVVRVLAHYVLFFCVLCTASLPIRTYVRTRMVPVSMCSLPHLLRYLSISFPLFYSSCCS